MEKHKKCTGCKGEFPITNFYKNKLIHDGHSNYLMKILMIEKMCKNVLEEVENLKRGFIKTETEVVE